MVTLCPYLGQVAPSRQVLGCLQGCCPAGLTRLPLGMPLPSWPPCPALSMDASSQAGFLPCLLPLRGEGHLWGAGPVATGGQGLGGCRGGSGLVLRVFLRMELYVEVQAGREGAWGQGDVPEGGRGAGRSRGTGRRGPEGLGGELTRTERGTASQGSRWNTGADR